MDKISEVTEPLDNSELLSEKSHSTKAAASVKHLAVSLPKIVEHQSQAKRINGGGINFGHARKTRSSSDILATTPLSKLNFNELAASLDDIPRLKSNNKHRKFTFNVTNVQVEDVPLSNNKMQSKKKLNGPQAENSFPVSNIKHATVQNSPKQKHQTPENFKSAVKSSQEKDIIQNKSKNTNENLRSAKQMSRSVEALNVIAIKENKDPRFDKSNTDVVYKTAFKNSKVVSKTSRSGSLATPRKSISSTEWSSTTLSSQVTAETADETEDHINVVLRVRPLNSNETTRKDQFACTFSGDGKIEVDNNGSVRQFCYNVVFEPDATQGDLFDHSGVKKLIDMAVNGYACTALAFGQTGSGKTHTMTGPPQQFQEGKVDPEMYGIIQRSLKYLFTQLSQQQGTKVIRASYLEIYNEQVIDLLNPNMRRYLQVRWSKNKGFYVENLFVVECETEDDLKAVLDEGMHNRQTGSHGLNEFSSRSHSMLMLTIDSEMQDPDDENLYITKRGKLTFVDLAGSEKVKDSQSTADTLVESNSINKSLLVLGNCISSLGDQKKRQGHIPYRDSKLTKLLADSLGGNGVTLMICCITPSSYNASETMNTLRYASRAKKIQTKPVIKMDPREKLILSLKKEIKVLRNENHYLRQQLDFPDKPNVQLLKENDQKYIKMMKEANGKPDTNGTVNNRGNEKLKQNGGSADESGLYEMLQEYMVENETLRTEAAEMQVVRDKIRQEQQLLYRDNEKLMKRVDDLERRLNQAQSSWQSMPRQGSNQLREHSPPRASPQYVKAISSGVVTNGSLPARAMPTGDNPALRDHVYTVTHLQGYTSPTSGNGRNKQPLPNRGSPLKPPHRLAESIPVQQQRPVNEQNGAYMNGGPPAQYRTVPLGSPIRDLQNDSRRSSRSSSSDAIRDMNEKLKQELVQLDGQIQQNQVIAYSRPSPYGPPGALR